MKKFLLKKKAIEKELTDLNISTIVNLKATLTGILFGAVISIIPILVCVNLLVLYKYVGVLIFFITLFLMMFATLSIYFNFEALKIYCPDVKKIDTKFLVLSNSIFSCISLLIIMMIAFIILNIMNIY